MLNALYMEEYVWLLIYIQTLMIKFTVLCFEKYDLLKTKKYTICRPNKIINVNQLIIVDQIAVK